MREFHPMPTTPGAMRHFGQAAKRRDGKDSQTVSFSQIVSLVSGCLTLADNGDSPIPTLVTSMETYTISRRGREPAPCPDTGARACPVLEKGVKLNRKIKTTLTRHLLGYANSSGESHDRVITNASTYGYMDAITSGGAG